MANIVLPAVPVLQEINNDTTLLIEQAGEINRYPISNLDVDIDIDTFLSTTSENPVQNKVITKAIEDAGSIDVDFDISNEGKPNSINADKLGGYDANEYAKIEDLVNINAGISMELLWENASPTSEFAARIISLDLNPYKIVLIESILKPGSTQIINNLVSKDDSLQTVLGGFTEGNYYRLAQASNTGIQFGNGYKYITSESANAASCVPLKIYGIKGVSA